MTEKISRRNFVEGVGAASLAAPAILSARTPSDVVGLGCIGMGIRGHILHHRAYNLMDDVEVRSIADLYTGFQKRAVETSTNPRMQVHEDYRRVIDDPDVDAVVIAVPDFWHARMAIEAARAGKDVYVEKPLTHTMPEAVALEQTIRATGRVFQLGHQRNSDPVHLKAREIVQAGLLGKICLVRTMWFRHSEPDIYRVYATYTTPGVPPDANPRTINWDAFQVNARRKVPFNAERFFHWHCYWDYNVGIAGDILSHEMDAMNFVMEAGMPDSCIATGQLNYWKDGREVPDTWYALYQFPEKDLTVTWENASHNSFSGEGTHYLGDQGTMVVTQGGLKIYTEGVNDLHRYFTGELLDGKPVDRSVQGKPVFEYKPPHGTNTTLLHVQDFIDCVKTRETCSCGIEKAFEEAAYVHLSVESYRKKRQVRWDQARREIV